MGPHAWSHFLEKWGIWGGGGIYKAHCCFLYLLQPINGSDIVGVPCFRTIFQLGANRCSISPGLHLLWTWWQCSVYEGGPKYGYSFVWDSLVMFIPTKFSRDRHPKIRVVIGLWEVGMTSMRSWYWWILDLRFRVIGRIAHCLMLK